MYRFIAGRERLWCFGFSSRFKRSWSEPERNIRCDEKVTDNPKLVVVRHDESQNIDRFGFVTAIFSTHIKDHLNQINFCIQMLFHLISESRSGSNEIFISNDDILMDQKSVPYHFRSSIFKAPFSKTHHKFNIQTHTHTHLKVRHLV